MEKMKNGRNGVMISNNRLPPGFRFQPTDEELVFQYLKCKVFSSHLHASIIPHINLFNYDPWDLPGICDEEDRYCFSSKEAKYQKGNRMNRTTKSGGHWKATGSDRKILPPIRSINNIIGSISGIRKTLVFYEGKSPCASRTDWLMHEYRLLIASNSSQPLGLHSYGNEIGDWVLCHIFKKKRSIESDHNNNTTHHHMLKNNNNNNNTIMMKKNVVTDVAKPRFFDFMMVNNSASGPIIHYSSTSSSSTCSSSSYITEISSLDKEETSDGYDDS